MPNQMPGAAHYVRHNMNTLTAGVGINPTYKGHSMAPSTVVPLLPGMCFDARGTGKFALSQPGAFPRGTRVSGRRGTLDLWVTTGTTGSARTLAYLTDSLDYPYNYIAIQVDSSNRPLLAIQQIATPLSAAVGTLTAVGPITDTETITIDGKVYTVLDTLVNADGNVLKGTSVGATLDNLEAAINLGVGKGTLYAASMTRHSTVSALRGPGTLGVTAKLLGPSGNTITTTETAVDASWGGATLAGGAGTTTTIASVTPSYTAVSAGRSLHIRMAWNSEQEVSGGRYASLKVNEEVIPSADWVTDPIASWSAFQPQYLVLGSGLLGGADFNGVVQAVQISEQVTL